MAQLKVGHWNVAGIKDKEKFNNVAFVNYVKAHDIVCLSETHCGIEEDLEIKDYYCFKLCRKETKKLNRFFGGITIYCKREIKNGIKFLKHQNDDYVWLNLDKDYLNLSENIFLCYAYIPPENSSYYVQRKQHTLDFIEAEILEYSQLGSVMILGDLNARTGTKSDYVTQDADVVTIENLLVERDVELGSRLSQDLKICPRGNKLIDICVSAKLRILNGRIIGDTLGYFTCHKNNGSSVVDYLIVQENLVSEVNYLCVNEFLPCFSDHCSLSFALKTKRPSLFHQREKTYEPFPNQFKWNNQFISDFQLALNQDEVKAKINDLLRMKCNNRQLIEESLNNINTILQKAASKAKVYKKLSNNNSKARNKKWFDNDLKRLKSKIKHFTAILRLSPFDSYVRKELFFTLHKYNKLRKKKARLYKQTMVNKLHEMRSKDPTEFWKLLKNLDENGKIQKQSLIPMPEWENYFKLLHKAKEDQSIQLEQLEADKIFCPTDFKITEIEVIQAIKKLKRNKAAGLDNILNEMIIYSQSFIIKLLTKLFNEILLTGNYPTLWKESYIIPLFKAGDSTNPSNYRGIAITSNFSKLFNSILNTRLIDHFDDNDVIHEYQLGFKKGFRTSDNLFIVRSLIDKYSTKGQKLYACFIDFRKAFDSINHRKLLMQLKKTKIGSRIYNVLKDMYINQNNNVQVKIGDLLSHKFSSGKGVRQGDSLSPLLFNFYVNVIFRYLLSDSHTPTIGTSQVPALLYADDLVLFSTNLEGLQTKMNQLVSFCQDWDLEINLSKSKAMLFRRSGKKCNEKLTLKTDQIEFCQEYRYLGVILQSNGGHSKAFDDLSRRAQKAIFKLKKSFNGEVPSFNVCLHLFDSMIKPILAYGSDVWAPFLFSLNQLNFKKLLQNSLEKCHQKFLKFALGVNRHTPIIGLYGETGRFPLAIMFLLNSLKYISRIDRLNESSILYQCYSNNKLLEDKTSFCNRLKSVIKCIDGNSVDIVGSMTTNCILKAKLQSTFQTFWHDSIHDDTKSVNGNKLRNYRIYKTNFRKEDYLNNLYYFPYRSKLANLRLSSHKLHIETGRYVNSKERLNPEDRICNNCNLKLCEDEFHFIVICPNYSDIRKNMIDNIVSKHPSISQLDNDRLYIWLMSNLNSYVITALAKFVTEAFKHRQSTSLNS